jgi:hypothetical protein
MVCTDHVLICIIHDWINVLGIYRLYNSNIITVLSYILKFVTDLFTRLEDLNNR